jgi:hypothetical protein
LFSAYLSVVSTLLPKPTSVALRTRRSSFLHLDNHVVAILVHSEELRDDGLLVDGGRGVPSNAEESFA